MARNHKKKLRELKMGKRTEILEAIKKYKTENKEITIFLRNGKSFRGVIGGINNTNFKLISKGLELTITAGDCSAVMASRDE